MNVAQNMAQSTSITHVPMSVCDMNMRLVRLLALSGRPRIKSGRPRIGSPRPGLVLLCMTNRIRIAVVSKSRCETPSLYDRSRCKDDTAFEASKRAFHDQSSINPKPKRQT